MGTILNQILDYLVTEKIPLSLLKKIINSMEKELNKRYNGKDWYNFDGKKQDEKRDHNLKEFLKKHPKTIFQFKTTYKIPDLYKD